MCDCNCLCVCICSHSSVTQAEAAVQGECGGQEAQAAQSTAGGEGHRHALHLTHTTLHYTSLYTTLYTTHTHTHTHTHTRTHTHTHTHTVHTGEVRELLS